MVVEKQLSVDERTVCMCLKKLEISVTIFGRHINVLTAETVKKCQLFSGELFLLSDKSGAQMGKSTRVCAHLTSDNATR